VYPAFFTRFALATFLLFVIGTLGVIGWTWRRRQTA
jgi:hypothetical protein